MGARRETGKSNEFRPRAEMREIESKRPDKDETEQIPGAMLYFTMTRPVNECARYSTLWLSHSHKIASRLAYNGWRPVVCRTLCIRTNYLPRCLPVQPQTQGKWSRASDILRDVISIAHIVWHLTAIRVFRRPLCAPADCCANALHNRPLCRTLSTCCD